MLLLLDKVFCFLVGNSDLFLKVVFILLIIIFVWWYGLIFVVSNFCVLLFLVSRVICLFSFKLLVSLVFCLVVGRWGWYLLWEYILLIIILKWLYGMILDCFFCLIRMYCSINEILEGSLFILGFSLCWGVILVSVIWRCYVIIFLREVILRLWGRFWMIWRRGWWLNLRVKMVWIMEVFWGELYFYLFVCC